MYHFKAWKALCGRPLSWPGCHCRSCSPLLWKRVDPARAAATGKIQETSWIQLVQKKHQSPTSLDSLLVCFFLAQHKFALSHQSASPWLSGCLQSKHGMCRLESPNIDTTMTTIYDGIPDVKTTRKTIKHENVTHENDVSMLGRTTRSFVSMHPFQSIQTLASGRAVGLQKAGTWTQTFMRTSHSNWSMQ